MKLCLPQNADFICQSFYASIGYAIPAALGAKLAAPQARLVVFVGDGAFQMTGQELSTIIRCGHNSVIFLINNDGYQIERVIYDNLYNNLQMWDYTLIPEAYGGKKGVLVRTEGDLESVLVMANQHPDDLVFAEVRLERMDFSETLRKMGKASDNGDLPCLGLRKGCLCFRKLAKIFLCPINVTRRYCLAKIALGLCRIEKLIVVEGFFHVGEDDPAGDNGMVVSDVGVLKTCAVLQLHVQASPEFIYVYGHMPCIHLVEDDPRLFSRCRGLGQNRPVSDAQLPAHPAHFISGNILR